MKRLLFILSLAFTVPVFAADATPTPTPVVAPAKVPVKDAALAFILEKAEKYSGSLESAIGQAVDVAKRETPLVIEEFLKWRFYQGLFWTLFPVFLLGIALSLLKFTRRVSRIELSGANDGFQYVPFVVNCVLCVAFTIAALVSFANHAPDLLKIKVAPRVYLIEEALALVKK